MTNCDELVKALRTMRMAREDIENSLKVLSHIVDDDFVITADESRKIIGIDGETIEALQAEVTELKRVNLEIFEDLPKRGEWIGRQNHKKCSVCGVQAIYDVALQTDMKTPYCPHCGAKMEVQE